MAGTTACTPASTSFIYDDGPVMTGRTGDSRTRAGKPPALGAEESYCETRPWAFYYDGDCGFCARSVRWLRRIDFRRRVTWLPYQSLNVPPAGLSWQDLDSEAYSERDGRLEGGFYAFRRLTLLLPPLFPLAPLFWLPGVNLLGAAVYRRVARNRSRLTPEGCEMDGPL